MSHRGAANQTPHAGSQQPGEELQGRADRADRRADAQICRPAALLAVLWCVDRRRITKARPQAHALS